MKIAAIGRSGATYNAIRQLSLAGHHIVGIQTDVGYPEYDRQVHDFEVLASELGARFRVAKSTNDPATLDWLLLLQADLGVSVNWRSLISAQACHAVGGRILNAHLGDLPRFRGNATPNWAILSGESSIALTIHEMTAELDGGPVWRRTHMEIGPGTRLGDIHSWFLEQVGELFVAAVDALAKGESATPQQEDPAESLRCYPRMAADSHIDWRQECSHIERLVRASSEPLPGAYTYFRGQLLRVWRAGLPRVTPAPFLAVPGQVLSVDQRLGGVLVATGKGALELLEVQLQGNSRQRASDLLSSIRIRLGMDAAQILFEMQERIHALEISQSNDR